MGITHSEFFRTLPAALASSPYSVQGHDVVISDDGRRLLISLSPESRRRLGALSLPTTRVQFTFSGYTSQDIDRFMARFDRAFQRGGG
jgi:hypothetical protein